MKFKCLDSDETFLSFLRAVRIMLSGSSEVREEQRTVSCVGL